MGRSELGSVGGAEPVEHESIQLFPRASTCPSLVMPTRTPRPLEVMGLITRVPTARFSLICSTWPGGIALFQLIEVILGDLWCWWWWAVQSIQGIS